MCAWEVLDDERLYLRGTEFGNLETVYKDVCKAEFSKQNFTKTSGIDDIHERNYIIFEVFFSIEI